MKGRIFAGFIVIIIGIIFLLSSLGVVNIGWSVWDFWPLILVILGIMLLGKSKSNNINAFILIILGGLFLLRNFGFFQFSFSKAFFALLIILVGLLFLTKGPKLLHSRNSSEIFDKENSFEFFMIFGGLKKEINSLHFQFCRTTTLFAGTELDLSNMEIAPEGGEINIFCAFGGTEIIFPQNYHEKYNIDMDIIAILGSAEDKIRKRAVDPKMPTLKITGLVMFGGAEIHI